MKIFTNKHWQDRVISPSSCYYCCHTNNKGYDNIEYIAANYYLNPLDDQVASTNKLVFDPKKAAAMYFWYKSSNKADKSIVEYFEEYKKCIDDTHQWFNSNYGIYAYKNKGLQRCIDVLLKNPDSRQACFCINNNAAMAPESIDKLCTNTIHFFIREKHLIMIVQMRSSNMLALLPYDFFIFSVWYAQVFNKLLMIYHGLRVSDIFVQVASLHKYYSDIKTKMGCTEETNINQIFSYDDMCDHNFENILESKLLKFLNI